jgi:hypothetical protein
VCLFLRKTQKKNQRNKKFNKKDKVSNIYTIIMVLKLKHELGMGNQELLERRRGYGTSPNLWF